MRPIFDANRGRRVLNLIFPTFINRQFPKNAQDSNFLFTYNATHVTINPRNIKWIIYENITASDSSTIRRNPKAGHPKKAPSS